MSEHGNAIVSEVARKSTSSDLNDPEQLRHWLENNLMGYAEVCEDLEVQRTNLQHIKDLPDPVANPECGRIWLRSDITAFVKVYNARRDRRKRVG